MAGKYDVIAISVVLAEVNAKVADVVSKAVSVVSDVVVSEQKQGAVTVTVTAEASPLDDSVVSTTVSDTVVVSAPAYDTVTNAEPELEHRSATKALAPSVRVLCKSLAKPDAIA
jgi:hypothetical protein